MIFTLIFTGFNILLQGLFSLFTVPAMPQPIIDGLSWIITNLGQVVNLLAYALTPTFYTALLVVGIAVIFFDYVYGLLMWVLRKIPFLDIH